LNKYLFFGGLVKRLTNKQKAWFLITQK